MIGKIIKKDNRLMLHHIKGESFYLLEDENNPVVSLRENSYICFLLVNGDRYGLSSKARIKWYLTDKETEDFIISISF